MAEYTTMDAPVSGGPHIPPWLVIGGGVVALAAVVYVISKGGSGGTTAAGTSINAGLGSIQSAQQNLLGQLQTNQQQTNNAFNGLGNQVADTQAAILSAINDQGANLTQTIQSQIDIVNQNTNKNNQGVLSAISDALGKLLQGQQSITTTVQGGLLATNQNITSSTQQITTGQEQILNALQNTEQQTLGQVGTWINQLIGLQQQQASQSAAQAAQTGAQIQQLQNSISNSLANEQATFSAAFQGLGTQIQGLSGQVAGVSTQVNNLSVPLIGIYSRVNMPVPGDFATQPWQTQQAYLNSDQGDHVKAAIHWAVDAGNAVDQFYQNNPQYAPNPYPILFGGNL